MLSARTRLASPVDTARHGVYQPRPAVPFTGRITEDGPFTPRPSRYHVYGGWFCPWTHRVAITRELAGLHAVVTMSYVDGERDGRGWAFRATHGPDPVNGFTLLREVYEASEEGFDGHAGVPVLWDRLTCRVVSNDPAAIAVDLATRFRHLTGGGAGTYPPALRAEIDELDGRLRALLSPGSAAALLEVLDHRLARAEYLVGGVLTEADILLWVALVRHPGIAAYPNLHAYARRLYRLPAFRSTTRFPGFEAAAWQ